MNVSRKIKRVKSAFLAFLSRQSLRFVAKGSLPWLIGTESRYGGFVSGVPRNKVSPQDARTEEELKKGGMQGGDRMVIHGYGSHYANFLGKFDYEADLTVVECGILKGTGLAIWCDLFTNAKIVGLDIDLSHFNNNLSNLKASGAFSRNQPALREFDQFKDNRSYLEEILDGKTIDVFIDDGLHSHESIMSTLESVFPHLSEKFVYFIEDNDSVYPKVKHRFKDVDIVSDGEMTILSRNCV